LKTASSTTSVTGSTEPAYRALIRTIGLLKRVMEPYFAQHHITSSQWAVLGILSCGHNGHEGGLRLTDLSDRLLVRPPSVTGVVDRLQRMGLVRREISQDDHRAKMVVLTDDGHRIVQRVREGHAQRVQGVLGALKEEEQQELRRLLMQLGDHLEELAEAESKS
jgi:DNA-binding MarR family transcriptional regulator